MPVGGRGGKGVGGVQSYGIRNGEFQFIHNFTGYINLLFKIIFDIFLLYFNLNLTRLLSRLRSVTKSCVIVSLLSQNGI